MAETYTPKSPRPTRTQIYRVFGGDPDFAKKVEKIFDDLVSAAEAANANAAQIDELQDQSDSLTGLVSAAMYAVKVASDMAESAEHAAGQFNQLNARLRQLERRVSDIEEAP